MAGRSGLPSSIGFRRRLSSIGSLKPIAAESEWLDLKILTKTIPAVIQGSGAK